MKKNKKNYIKPKISTKKIRLNYFLSKVWWIDQFKFFGNVYAQSGGSGGGGSDGGYNDSGYLDASGTSA